MSTPHASADAADFIFLAAGLQASPLQSSSSPSPSSSPAASLDSAISGASFLWIITPLLILLVLGWLCITMKCRKARRTRTFIAEHWLPTVGPMHRRPEMPPAIMLSYLLDGNRTTSRDAFAIAWGPGGLPTQPAAAALPLEGLNELGEAPPPYQPKSLPPDYGIEPSRSSESDAAHDIAHHASPGLLPVVTQPPRAALGRQTAMDGGLPT